MLGGFIATVSTTQHVGSALDVTGARAYQAARAGTEWGVAQAINASSCVGSSNIGAFNGVSITVLCTPVVADEAGLGAIFSIEAIACNQPVAGACPGAAATPNYVERRLAALVER